MGGGDRGEGEFFGESEDEEEDLARTGAAFPETSDDEEDEANEDLSLKIVEKAMSMRAARMSSALRDEDASDGDGAGGPLRGEDVAAVSPEGKEKEKEELGSGEGSELHFIGLIPEEASEAVKPAVAVESEGPNSVEITDNAVMWKLLRGPRYFDPRDSSLGSCYNCGAEGHLAVNCTSEKRKKPCFICGSLEHGVKQCKKGQNCFICKKDGHRSKDCPGKQKSLSGKMCLKCGESGHDMFFCTRSYPTDDLKVIQCYICREFGHLCCLDSVDPDPAAVSCYRCGELGHTGLACGNSHERTAGEGTPSSCFRCGEEGHFARECRNSSKARATNLNVLSSEVTPRRCHRCENFGEKGHLARERSSTGALSPSLCYKCNEEGHFAWECKSSSKLHASGSNGPVNGVIASLCYKCGEGGHFARECRKSNKTILQKPAICKRCGEVGHFANENKCSTMTPTLCYSCGESGHFSRDCPKSLKRVERENGLSTPSSKRRNDYHESKSMPNGDVKASKRKKTEKPDSRAMTPYKPKHRGGWITEDPGDWSSENYRKVRKSPPTKETKSHKDSTPKSPGSGKASWHSLRSHDDRSGRGWRSGNHIRW
ncbi:hypothetical protein MLD38_025339 [Melastoma candidum]|uniref:Uncharacterized protein n=1 Tax=Melastoma candidum TaxID=119954 RepID=A0ACB9NV25_9MYRT|nr:hypothetical protein MLD38_025339 [Melastoma candidum]